MLGTTINAITNFFYPKSQNETENKKFSVLAVSDIRCMTINEKTKRFGGSVDLSTVPFNGSGSEAYLKGKIICRYKSFFLEETKSTYYKDERGNKISPVFFNNNNERENGFWLTLRGPVQMPISSNLYRNDLTDNNFALLDVKQSEDGTIKSKFVTKTASLEYGTITKVREYGKTVSDGDSALINISQEPKERFFNAYRIVNNLDQKNPNDKADFDMFCKICDIKKVAIFPGFLKETAKL